MNLEKSLKFRAILVPEKITGGYTAFFTQFPEILASGETKEMALENLIDLAQAVFAFKEKEEMASADMPDDIITQDFELAMA